MSGLRLRRNARLFRPALLGTVLGGFLSLGPGTPAGAQSWPGDSGPSSDVLGLAMRQYERLGPPPVEANGRAERVVPGMPATDLAPVGSVDVGSPMISRAALPTPSGEWIDGRAHAPVARRAAPVAQRTRGNRERELTAELAARNREIRALRRQIRGGRG